MEEEKQLYKILAQQKGITISANTSEEVTFDEAKSIAIESVIGGIQKTMSFEPFVVLPITTKERWRNGDINFCPRCGYNLQDMQLENFAEIDCHNCGSISEVHIMNVLDEDDD